MGTSQKEDYTNSSKLTLDSRRHLSLCWPGGAKRRMHWFVCGSGQYPVEMIKTFAGKSGQRQKREPHRREFETCLNQLEDFCVTSGPLLIKLTLLQLVYLLNHLSICLFTCKYLGIEGALVGKHGGSLSALYELPWGWTSPDNLTSDSP